MKTLIYTMRDKDGIFAALNQSSHRHFIAEHLQNFYKKVGQWTPVDWLILGEFETTTGKFTLYDEPEVFDWEKQLEIDSIQSAKNDGVESSLIAQELSESKSE